jgi:hypothetical protein
VQLLAPSAFEYFQNLRLVGIGKAGQQWPEQGSVIVHGVTPDELEGHRGAGG